MNIEQKWLFIGMLLGGGLALNTVNAMGLIKDDEPVKQACLEVGDHVIVQDWIDATILRVEEVRGSCLYRVQTHNPEEHGQYYVLWEHEVKLAD